jgi:hypothetical protein
MGDVPLPAEADESLHWARWQTDIALGRIAAIGPRAPTDHLTILCAEGAQLTPERHGGEGPRRGTNDPQDPVGTQRLASSIQATPGCATVLQGDVFALVDPSVFSPADHFAHFTNGTRATARGNDGFEDAGRWAECTPLITCAPHQAPASDLAAAAQTTEKVFSSGDVGELAFGGRALVQEPRPTLGSPFEVDGAALMRGAVDRQKGPLRQPAPASVGECQPTPVRQPGAPEPIPQGHHTLQAPSREAANAPDLGGGERVPPNGRGRHFRPIRPEGCIKGNRIRGPVQLGLGQPRVQRRLGIG